MIDLVATFFYTGRLRPAPGTWGSAAAVLAGVLLHLLGGPLLLLIGLLAVLVLGWWAADAYMAREGTHDPSEIVIDEVAGQWIALLPVSLGAAHAGAGIGALWPGLVAAFVFFRLFDILKPGPVGWADAQPGAFGVMLDDVIAGWMAALLVAVSAFVFHGVLGL